LKDERERISSLIAQKDSIAKEVDDIEKQLVSLDNPSARIKIQREIAASSDDVKAKIAEAKVLVDSLTSEKDLIGAEMSRFESLDADLRSAFEERDETEKDHKAFLANEKLADKRSELENQIKELDEKISVLVKSRDSVSSNLVEKSADYDANLHYEVSEAVKASESLLVEYRTELRSKEERISRLSEELARISEIRASLHNEFQERQRLEEVLEATAFIRETLKAAAPRVARNYVHHVSIEAAQMFREITGDAELTLKWADDYGIVLEEAGHERPFVSLSGGEQMVAALAVRLALLKQMSDIRIAFFDEPTTNMDAERRERLAEQVSQITQRQTFEQLFVISHDDTFESYVDNLITVGDDF